MSFTIGELSWPDFRFTDIGNFMVFYEADVECQARGQYSKCSPR